MTQELQTASQLPSVADAEITTVKISGEGCEIGIEGDTQGAFSLLVPDAVGLVELSCVRESLSHVSWSESGEPHRRFITRSETTKENVHVLHFFSAWTSEPVLEVLSTSRRTIVASSLRPTLPDG